MMREDSPRARIAVFVSGGGTNLQALLDASARGEIPHGEIVLVLSSRRDAYALERARKEGVATVVVPRAELDQDEFEQRISSELAARDIDLIILAGFMSILSQNLIRSYEKRIINVHPSLIPSFCGKGFYGLRVHEAALDRGVKISGATVHFVNEIPDGGEIIAQKSVAVEPDDTPETLQRRIMEQAEWILLPQAAETVSKKIMSEKGETL